MATKFHLDRYFVQLYGIKQRLDIIDRFIKLELTTWIVGCDVEFVCLQFRKLLEQIAMLSLVAHFEEYSKIQKQFATQWNAKKILKELEQLNKYYYPIAAKINQDDRGKFIDPILDTDVLTKDNFLELYQKTSEVIHAENPYIQDPKLPRPIEATFEGWHKKIHNLIDSHVIVLYNMDYTLFGSLHNDTGIPHIQVLGKISD